MAKNRKPIKAFKKGQTIARTTISVPCELKRRMDGVSGVNWSALASAAFETKLSELNSIQEVRDMSDVVERLRASKKESDSEVYSDGRSDGEEWAKKFAEARELQRLEAWRGGVNDSDWLRILESDQFDLCAVTNPGMDQREFWEFVLGDDAVYSGLPQDHDWLQGFVDGALALWGEVKGKL